MTSPDVKLGRLLHCTFAQALELRNRGFEHYHRDMQTTMESLLSGFGNHGIRPELSIVAYVEDEPVGFVFLAVKTFRGKKLVWNGGTGVFPEYRGRGIAKAMMEETQRVMVGERVDRAILEVNAGNVRAIAAYKSGGFAVADRLIGLVRTEPLKASFYAGELPAGWSIRLGRSADVFSLPFYRELAAWSSMGHGGGESVIVYDAERRPLAYSLFTRVLDDDGRLKSATLRQCETDPMCVQREACFRIMLGELFGPPDQACVRRADNLSMSNPDAVDLLKQAGFDTDYEAFLMIWDNPE
jgi:ribosomal protein S18 acetylase RimI-like enzyme